MYLELVETPSTVKKVLAEYSLVLKNWKNCWPKNLLRQYEEETGEYKWFSTVELTTDVSNRWGFTELPLQEYPGFSMGDYIVVEAKVKIKAEVTNFS